MPVSTGNQITIPADQNFFLAPQFPLQRQYEALRAFFVDEELSADAARRSGYSPGAFRVLCHQFRHDSDKRSSFRQPQRGPQSTPARDRVRDLAVAMRKRNLSVYDIQRELATVGHTISINSLTVLLHEEGFSRLPRRADDERLPTVKPEIAEVADVRHLDLSPRSFRTPVAGLFLFVPLLDRMDLHSVVTAARLPGSNMFPAAAARRKRILVFLARDAEQGVLRYANAGVTKGEQSDEILQFVRFWKKHSGKPPAELVFDSQLTTYEKLSELNREGICFITLRRRSEKMLREIYSQPDSAWRRISLPALTRIYRSPKVLEERVTLSGYEGELRQLTVMELGHEEPTVLLTNHRKLGPVELVTRYAQRMLIENGISEAVQFFHIDALSSMVGMKVDFDMQLTLAASSLYRMMAQRIGREYSHSQAKTVFRNLLDLSGKVEVTATSVVVTLDKRAHNPYLVASGLTDQPTSMPWFGDKKLIIQFA